MARRPGNRLLICNPPVVGIGPTGPADEFRLILGMGTYRFTFPTDRGGETAHIVGIGDDMPPPPDDMLQHVMKERGMFPAPEGIDHEGKAGMLVPMVGHRGPAVDALEGDFDDDLPEFPVLILDCQG